MKKLLLLVVVVLASSPLLLADVYIRQETKTAPFMGQPGRTIIAEHWLAKDKMATVTPDMSQVMDTSQKKFFQIQHKTKTYLETSLPLDITKLMPEQMAAMMKGQMEGMTVSVNPNGQTKKVLNWNASGYDVKMTMMGMEMKMAFWASKDVPFDWKTHADRFAELWKAQMRVGEKFMEEFRKIQGFVVATEMNMMGTVVTTTTLEIADKPANPSVYSVPAGYTKKDKLSMEDMQQR